MTLSTAKSLDAWKIAARNWASLATLITVAMSISRVADRTSVLNLPRY
jgi:hypothetical protein